MISERMSYNWEDVSLALWGNCPTTTENNFKLIPYLYNSEKWTGWDLNPRPQQCGVFSQPGYLPDVR